MNIREARAEDTQGIQDLYAHVMQYHYPMDEMRKMIEIVYADQNNYVFIAEEDKTVIGVIEVVIKYSIHKKSYLIINTLAVSCDHQNKGTGTQLLRYAEAFAKARQLGSISVGSQVKRVQAHHFYQKNGFELIKEHKIFEKML